MPEIAISRHGDELGVAERQLTTASSAVDGNALRTARDGEAVGASNKVHSLREATLAMRPSLHQVHVTNRKLDTGAGSAESGRVALSRETYVQKRKGRGYK